MYIVLLAYVVVCDAVFHDVFNIMGVYVTPWTGIIRGVIQPLLITQKGWVMSAPQPGQVDSVLSRESCFRRVDVGGSSVQLRVVFE